MRVVIAEDQALLREGLARLFRDGGHHVVATLGDAELLLATVARERPDLAVVDIRMPPTFTDEGARAARMIKEQHPGVGVLVLSQHIETTHAVSLVAHGGFGYLLKDRVVDVATLIDALERIARGGTVLDPSIVAHFLGRQAARDRLVDLTERERQVLALMAEGRSNRAIGRELAVTEKTVETHIASIFSKFELRPEPDDHRRVLAVRAWMEP